MHRRSMLKATLLASAAATLPRNAFASVGSGTTLDPVQFWNAAAVDLIALDHSITISSMDDTVAIGPAGSSRALGVIHAVIADAASYAYNPSYKAYFNKTSPGSIQGDPGLFVGGAAYAIMLYIYSPTIFSDLVLSGAMSNFRTNATGTAQDATWAAGVSFGSAPVFRDLWNGADVKNRLKSNPSLYTPPPTQAHMPDPWNCTQGFYGQLWGSIAPLVLTEADVQSFAANELKVAPIVGTDELNLLIAKGGRNAADADGTGIPARTWQELAVGGFWAYENRPLIGTPPVLINKIVLAVAAGDNLNTPDTARLLALSHLAMADATVVSFEAKWRLALWRPVVAIQALTAKTNWQPYGSPHSNPDYSFTGSSPGGNTAAMLLGASAKNAPLTASPLMVGAKCLSDPAYSAAASTPNFPSYPSGHTTLGGACFNAMLLFRTQRGITDPNTINITITSAELDGQTMDNYDPSSTRPNLPATFTSLVAANPYMSDLGALTENIDVSRIFLGVHWAFDEIDGDIAGRRVGNIVYSKAYVVT